MGRFRPSFHIDKVSVKEIGRIVATNVRCESTLMTDEGRHYATIGKQFAGHETVEHTRGEYVRDDAHTNTLEGYYSIFTRGMKGVCTSIAVRSIFATVWRSLISATTIAAP